MEDLISRIGSVKLEPREYTSIQVYSNISHFRAFISRLITYDFKKSMVENNKLGMNFITLFGKAAMNFAAAWMLHNTRTTC